jgi:acetyltransferase-like isoleucine patch superfamily enzyme
MTAKVTMNPGQIARRFLPGHIVSLVYWLKFGCFVSPRAEVELTKNIQIGRRTQISSFCKIKASDGPLTIGADTSIGTSCFIAAGQAGASIGNDCLISPLVTILASDYRYQELNVPIRRQGQTSKGVRIADNVWLGAGVAVLDGSDIGEGAIIAPNSVVSFRVPPNAIIQGNPAKVIFTRR